MVDVVARKGLQASNEEILVLSIAAPGFSLLASMWAALMEGRVKRPFIIAAALLGRGALLFAAIVSGSAWFIALCCAVSLFDPIFITASQAILQANYDSSWRGRLHGSIILWTRPAIVVSSLGAAILLDMNPEHYRWLFPVSGALGVAAFLQFAFLRVRRREPRTSTLGGWRRVWEVLRTRPDFFAFERNFFVYGTAFHMLVPITVFLLVDHLHISYRDNALSRIVLFQVIFAAFSPLAGHLLDRWRAPRTSALAFMLLGAFPLLLLAAGEFQSIAMIYAAYGWFGISMAFVNTAWNLGAMQFSGRDDASIFMGIHVSAVGLRGLIAPPLGYYLYEWLGMSPTLLVAAGFFLLSGLFMVRLDRRMRQRTV